MTAVLFVLGLSVGSFLDVLANRYHPQRFLLSLESIGGRSRCVSCGKSLKWFELLPVVSFALQAGRCRNCGSRLSFEYPLVELLSGLVFVFVPRAILPAHGGSGRDAALAALWILAFLTFLLIALIDLKTNIIPDEANVFLAVLGAAVAFLSASKFGLAEGSFVGHFAALAGARGNIWANRLFAASLGAVFFLALILLTRGRGMGGGDLKLAASLGILFGWPDVGLIVALAFVTGSAFGIGAIAAGRKTLKNLIPFGPFLSLSAGLTFFFGAKLVELYFALFHG